MLYKIGREKIILSFNLMRNNLNLGSHSIQLNSANQIFVYKKEYDIDSAFKKIGASVILQHYSNQLYHNCIQLS